MDVHKNARLTAYCRALLVRRALQGRSVGQLAREMGISVPTVRKWLRRYRAEGEGGLRDRSCRPRRSPRATVRELQLAVIALRRQRLTLVGIAMQLGLSRSTVARICARAGLNRLSKLEPVPHYPCYERISPGELLHLDVKKLGRIVQIGHRITGDHRDRTRGVGWEYVHVAIDDASRVAYSQVLPNEEGESAAMFLRAAVAYYAGLGVQVREVLTDNGVSIARKSLHTPVESSGSGIDVRDPIHRALMARPSALSTAPCASGPTHAPIGAPNIAVPSSLAGYTATTGIARMPAWQRSHPSAESVSTETIC